MRIFHRRGHPLGGLRSNRAQTLRGFIQDRFHLADLFRREIELAFQMVAHPVAHHFAVPNDKPVPGMPRAGKETRRHTRPGRRARDRARSSISTRASWENLRRDRVIGDRISIREGLGRLVRFAQFPIGRAAGKDRQDERRDGDAAEQPRQLPCLGAAAGSLRRAPKQPRECRSRMASRAPVASGSAAARSKRSSSGSSFAMMFLPF